MSPRLNSPGKAHCVWHRHKSRKPSASPANGVGSCRPRQPPPLFSGGTAFIGIVNILLKHCADGAFHPPKPRNPTGVCDSIEFRFFPGSLKQKGPMGPRVAYTCGVSGGLGLQLKDLHEPGIRALKVLPPNAAGPFPGRRHTSPGFHASSNTPRAWRNILTYNLTSPLLGRRLN